MPRRAAMWVFVALWSCLVAGSARAFEVDMWTSGLALDALVRVAQRHDLPLAPHGTSPPDDGYDHGTAIARWGEVTHYAYETHLLGVPCAVHLLLTPGSFQLYRVELIWPDGLEEDQQRYLRRTLREVLDAKYHRDRTRETLQDRVNGILTVEDLWVIDPTNSVRAATAERTELVYVDHTLRDKAFEEAQLLQRRQRSKITRAPSGDRERF